MGCNKIKSALFKYLKAINGEEQNSAWRRLEQTSTSCGYQTIAEAVLSAVCHKHISHQTYRWLNVKNGEIHIFYGGAIRKQMVFAYGHLIISCKDKLTISVHRRPFAKTNKAHKIPKPELKRLAACRLLADCV